MMARKKQVRSLAQKMTSKKNWTKGRLVNAVAALEEAYHQTMDTDFKNALALIQYAARHHYGDHSSFFQ